jgi:ribosomal protein S18 acetylase RimI-like enzyme
MHVSATAGTAAVLSGHQSVAAVVALSQRAGVRLDELSPLLAAIPDEQLSGALPYLDEVTRGGQAGHAAVLLQLHLIALVPPDELPALARLRRELDDRRGLSPESTRFVERRGVVGIMQSLLFGPFAGSEAAISLEPLTETFAFLRCAFLFLEARSQLLRDDSNLPALFAVLAKYGSLQRYYAAHDRPRRAVERLIECGFDAEHYVFGRGDLLQLGVSPLDRPDAWAPRVMQVTRRAIGGRGGGGLSELFVDSSRKIFHSIRQPYDALRRDGDRAAGLAVLDRLQAVAGEADERLLRKGLHVERAQVSSVLQEIEYLRSAAQRDDGQPPPQNLRAVRCTKRVPDLLFDNTRFACCLFKPAGLFHGEITRLLLDPLTPMIELWSDPHPEFLGLVTLYPGTNAAGEPVVLLDTFDYDDRLLDFKGYNRTMRFVLDSVAVDARLGGARKVVVFAAPYGKPIGFANFVRHEIRRHPSMRYQPGYFFESADPADGALDSLRSGRHHYTVALGYDRPMRGVIDYGFNHVGAGRVEKWLQGGRGVVEIDVARYLDERNQPQPPRPLHAIRARFDTRLHQRPPHHDTEIARREQRVIRNAAVDGPPIALTVARQIDPTLIGELARLDAATFPPALQYGPHVYHERWSRPGGCVVLAHAGSELAGFALCYQSITGAHDLFLDVVAVAPAWQHHGCGRALLETVLGLGTIWGFRRLLVLKVHNEPRLNGFYTKAGFRHLGMLVDRSDAFEADLGLAGVWARRRIDGIVEEVRARLAAAVPGGTVLCHLAPSDELVATMVSLERAFRPALRYDAAAFRRRLLQWDAVALEVRDGPRPVAFSVVSSDAAMPRHAMFFDSLCIDEAYQGRAVGRALHGANVRISSLAAYTTAVFHCEPRSATGVDLVALYTSLGGQEVTRDAERITMITPLRTADR